MIPAEWLVVAFFIGSMTGMWWSRYIERRFRWRDGRQTLPMLYQTLVKAGVPDAAAQLAVDELVNHKR